MNEVLQIELTRHQQELLLEGLRYVRSSRRLEFRNPLAPADNRRQSDLREIAALMHHLDAGSATAVPAEH